MRTHPTARRVWKLHISIACLAIAVLALCNLWAGGYCCRNLANTSMHQPGTQPVWNGSAVGAGVFLPM